MMIPRMLRRVVGLLRPLPSIRAFDLPQAILRELDVNGQADPTGRTAHRHRPFVFRIHPLSELTEYRDRLYLASFSGFGDKVV